MPNIKIEFTDKELIINKKFDLILKANYEDYDRIYKITFEKKEILIYALFTGFFYAENNGFLYLTNGKDNIFKINIKNFSVEVFESYIFIFDIFFYKNFIIIRDEIGIIILNKNFKKIKELSTEPFGIVTNCHIENDKIIYFGEENKKFEFDLNNISKK